MGPEDRQWVAIENHPELADLAMDLEPRVDFVGLATSMGVPATPIGATADIGDAVAAALAAGGPHLLHIPITG